MAKVRIQARSADVEESVEHKDELPRSHEFHHKHSKHAGALDILARVWKKEGFTGWYQVRIHPFSADLVRTDLFRVLGNGGPNYEGRSITSTTIYVKRAI
jgi:hypothetical protein